MRIIINKFGGEIMGSAKLINLAVDIIQKQLRQGVKSINVVSACWGVTDELELIIKNVLNRKYKSRTLSAFVTKIKAQHFDLAKKLLLKRDKKLEQAINKEIDDLVDHLRTLKQFGEISVVRGSLMSYGEKLSSLIFSEVLKQRGIKNKRHTSDNIGIITDGNYLNADIIYQAAKASVKKKFKLDNTLVVCGYCGKDKSGRINVLGRGGSDTTACFLGNVFQAEKIYLWKTVEGVLTTDPKIVAQAKTVKSLTYIEAAESGKVICDKAMKYAQSADIAVVVSSIINPKKYTVVNCHNDKKKVKLITYRQDQVLFEIRSGHMGEFGFLYKITELFTKYKINMHLIRNTRDAFYIVADNNNSNKKAADELIELGHYLKISPCAMVSIVGTLDWNITHKFNALLHQTVKNSRLGAFPYKNCTRLEAVVEPEMMNKLIKKLHQAFIG